MPTNGGFNLGGINASGQVRFYSRVFLAATYDVNGSCQ